jgi:hypothetical protein
LKNGLLLNQSRPIRAFTPGFHGTEGLDDLPCALFGHRGEFMSMGRSNGFRAKVILGLNFSFNPTRADPIVAATRERPAGSVLLLTEGIQRRC